VSKSPTPAPTPGHEIKQVVQLLHLSTDEFNQPDTKAVYEASYGALLGIYVDLAWVSEASVDAVASTRRAGINVEYTAVVPSTHVDAASTGAQSLTPSTLASAVSSTSTEMHNAGLTTSLIAAPTASQIGNIAVPVITVPTMAPTPAPVDLNQGSADGGSNIGMVVGIIVAVLVVCLLAAFGMWFLLGVPSTPPDVEMQTKHLEVNDLSIRSKDVQHQNTHGDAYAGVTSIELENDCDGPGIMFCERVWIETDARGVEEFHPIEGSPAGEEPPTPEEAPATPEEAPAGDIEVLPAAESEGARGVEEFPPIEGSSAGEEPPTPEEAPATPEEAPAGDIEVPPAAESHAQI